MEHHDKATIKINQNTLRVISWNVRSATKESPVWEHLLELNPSIALLQEVREIPEKFNEFFDIRSRVAITKTGNPQKFSTVILVKGKILDEIKLSSEHDWVNKELDYFKGNFISYTVHPAGGKPVNVVSVYSPAWPVDQKRLEGIDTSSVKLKGNPDVWATEIIWSALKNIVSGGQSWIVGGDYNNSETFDPKWQDDNNKRFGISAPGSKEILDRMYEMGFTECLREYNGKITPTFQHSSKRVDHQLDHLFVTDDLYPKLKNCTVGDQSTIFGNSLSDHLPIIADFN